VLLGVLAVVFGPLAVASVSTGSWGIPHNDDWDFIRSALLLHSTGTVQFSGWGQMTLVGQLALVQPLLAAHAGPGALDAFGLAATVVYVTASYGVARPLLGHRIGLLAAATVAVSPVLAICSTTFMTDVPAAALEMSALYLGCRAIGEGAFSRRFFTAAVVASEIAACIRETQAVVIVAIAATAILVTRNRADGSRRFVAVTSFVALALFAAVLLWRHEQPGATSFHYLSAATFFTDWLRLSSAAALFLIPVLVFVPWRSVIRNAPRLTWLAVAAAAILGAYQAANGSLLPGNLILPSGPTGDAVLAGVRPTLLPQSIWMGLNYAAAASLAGLLILLCYGLRVLLRGAGKKLLPRGPSPAALVIAVLAGMTLVTSASFYSSTAPFDRYTLPLVPLLAICVGLTSRYVLRREGGKRYVTRGRVLAAGLAGVGLLSLGLEMAVSNDAYDAARWRAGLLLSQSLNANRIDAGFEWSGFHARLPLQRGAPTTDPAFYAVQFGIEPCLLVTNSAGNGAKPVGKWTDATGGTNALFVLRLAAPGC